MSEELDNQVPLVDEIDTKVDKATSDIKNTNVRLKQTLNQVRSSHNFCIDIILLCIILGIVSYLYKKTEEYSVTKQSALNSGTQYYRGQGRTMPLNGAKKGTQVVSITTIVASCKSNSWNGLHGSYRLTGEYPS
ncbi:hypothetical protein G4B88_020153 [Cannabis sativa]|uniref:t-SNARE coiled-coil homology domain-containing protein n=1 Tax=Cannabis sativa TaxID=3483 RepID=A0A7J6EJH0_CANSA|nr:hypothetical protein G4B88_020153 [Cannabis sativa]